MGSIRGIIKDFSGEDDLAQAQREAVNSLAALAMSKADNFDLEIKSALRTAGQLDNQTIPISAVLSSIKETRAYSSTSADKISEQVNAALASFVSGGSGVLDGVGKLISGSITGFLGKADASTGLLDVYYVMTEGLSVVRIDLKCWYLNVAAESIYKKVERVSAFLGVKSTVDLAKIDFNTFLYLYQQQLKEGGLDASRIKEALGEAKLIYKDFKEMTSENVAAMEAEVDEDAAEAHLKSLPDDHALPGVHRARHSAKASEGHA